MPSKNNNPIYEAQEILSRRDHSEGELALKLKNKKFTSGEIRETIDKLKRSGLINDELFAHRCAEQILRTKAVGPRYLADKLRQKRIEYSLIEQVISDTYENGAEEELAEKAAKKWEKLHPKKAGDRQKLSRFLASRGFTQEAIISVLDPF